MNDIPLSRPVPRADTDMESGLTAVETALTRTTDALAGFETMVEKAEPEFRSAAERFRTLHTRHARTLATLLADAGRAPDGDGSLMGTVNRAVVATRAFFDRIDSDVLSQVVSGEEHVIDSYRAALDEPLPARMRETVAALLAEIEGLVAEVRPVA